MLWKIGVILKVNISEWGAPTFIQPTNNVTVRFLSNFGKINQIICRKPFSNTKTTRCDAKDISVYACVRIRPKHGVLSHIVTPQIHTFLYYCTPEVNVLVPKHTYVGLWYFQYPPRKIVWTLEGVYHGACINRQHNSYHQTWLCGPPEGSRKSWAETRRSGI